MDDKERKVAAKLVEDTLAGGYVVSVYDGEEYPLHYSNSKDEILKALGATDRECLLVAMPNKRHMGTIVLIYGNSPEELIADHTDSDLISTLIAGADALGKELTP